MIFTPKEHSVGSKYLVKSENYIEGFGPLEGSSSMLEIEILAYAPSGKFVKLSVGGDNGFWQAVENHYELLEELPSGKGKKTKQVLKG